MLQTNAGWQWTYAKEKRSFRWKLPTYHNLGASFDAYGDDRTRVAAFYEDDEGNEKTLTYWQLRNQSNQVANVLKAQGIRRGERVIVVLPRIVDFYPIYLGILKAGAVAIPVSQLFGTSALRYVIDNSGAAFLITSADLQRTILQNIRRACKSIRRVIVLQGRTKHPDVDYEDEMARASKYFKPVKTRGTELSTMLYTSGTTGMPKGVMHSHHWLIGNEPQVRMWQGIVPSDLVWCTADPTWITGLINAFLGPMSTAAAVLIHNGRFDPVRWFGLMEKYEVTVLTSAPTAFRLIMQRQNELRRKYDLKLRHVGSIGERMNDEIARWWQRKYHVQCYDGYGQTECMSFICNYPGVKDVPVRLGSAGKPMPGVDVALLNPDTMKPIRKPNTTGIVAVRRGSTPVLMMGYWKNPEKTKKVFKGKWYLAGDRAYIDRKGYWFIEGRDDDVIKTSGYRVGPYEVESSLLEHDAVAESAVIGLPDKTYGHIVKALVVLNTGFRPSEKLVKSLQRYVKEHLAAYKYPRIIEFVKELPKTGSGKIKRKVLRQKEGADE